MGIHREQSMAFLIPAIGAVCIAVDELSESEALAASAGEMVMCLLMI